jgi:hypothetical protein
MLTEQKMDDLIGMVKGFAPGIATALGGPLAGMAVSALSKQLGVKDEVDAVMKAINKDPEAEAKIKQLEHDKFKAILADKNSAREREMAIAASANAPLLNKIVTPALALGVTGLSFVLFAVLIFVEVKPEAKDILIYILGVLVCCGDTDPVLLLSVAAWEAKTKAINYGVPSNETHCQLLSRRDGQERYSLTPRYGQHAR